MNKRCVYLGPRVLLSILRALKTHREHLSYLALIYQTIFLKLSYIDLLENSITVTEYGSLLTFLIRGFYLDDNILNMHLRLMFLLTKDRRKV